MNGSLFNIWFMPPCNLYTVLFKSDAVLPSIPLTSFSNFSKSPTTLACADAILPKVSSSLPLYVSLRLHN